MRVSLDVYTWRMLRRLYLGDGHKETFENLREMRRDDRLIAAKLVTLGLATVETVVVQKEETERVKLPGRFKSSKPTWKTVVVVPEKTAEVYTITPAGMTAQELGYVEIAGKDHHLLNHTRTN